MQRTEVTAELVAEAERMVAQGATTAAVATALGITPYVAELIANNRGCQPCGQSHERGPRRIPNAQKGHDAVTIRMVRRMLDGGMLRHVEIAREVGVSTNMVTDVARGKRLPISMCNPYLQEGERFLPEPIRCSVCRALISVVPCRACYTRRQAFKKNSV